MASVADPTDSGTSRPVEPPIAQSTDHFEAVEWPPRDPRITFPAADDAYRLFASVFSDDQLHILAENTNNNHSRDT